MSNAQAALQLQQLNTRSSAEPSWCDAAEAELSAQQRSTGRRGGDGRDGLFSRLFRRNTPRPAPRPVTPAPQPVTPTPEVVAPTPEVVTPTPEVVAPTPEVEPPAPNLSPREPNQDTLPTGREIIEGWKQTSKGNCVTVAAIKAAQATFGPELANTEDPSRGVFASALTGEDGSLSIVMRDGFELQVSPEELEAAAASSRFKTEADRNDLLKNANELYAVAAKRAQIEGNDGFKPNTMSYSRALQSLEDGEITGNVMEQVGRLGLKDHASTAPRSELHEHNATLSSGAGHAYFVSNGERDYYGKAGALGGQSYTTRGRFGRRTRHPAHSSTGTVLHRDKVKK